MPDKTYKDTVISDEQMIDAYVNGGVLDRTIAHCYVDEAQVVAKAQAEATWPIAYKEGYEECSKTHFKPDWKVMAENIKEAIGEGRRIGRIEVTEWLHNWHRDVEMMEEYKSKLKEWGI